MKLLFPKLLSSLPSAPGRWTCWFILLTWLHMLLLLWPFVSLNISANLNSNTFFHLSVWICYSIVYLLPLITIIGLYKFRPGVFAAAQTSLILVLSIVLLLVIRTDWLIYDLYRFHINRFVLNLIMTPGGISSLGGTGSSYLSVAMIVARVVLIQIIFLVASTMISRKTRQHIPLPFALTAIFAASFLSQSIIYGSSDLMHYSPVLDGSKSYPMFQRVRFRSLARSFGYNRKEVERLTLAESERGLQYPLQPVSFSSPPRTPNIIMIVAESLRWDQLNAQTMPNSWRFAADHLRFTEHYSSGNGTREGLFGMFYGLYGSYWESFLHAGQPPLLMDRLQQMHYRFDLRTSAAFTYPEFDRTLFAGMDSAQLYEADDAMEPWQRDRYNMDQLLDFLDGKSTDQPFMSFFFMESTHAAYDFPADSALVDGYQQDTDYTLLSRAELADNAEPLYRRYINAAHWVDVQLGRLYEKLAAGNLLDNTIVIITGDHGEEFMEKGAWGHNSAFVEEQTHVPMLMHIPGKAPAVINDTTSHLDIATTLLQLLGAEGDPLNYSLGMNLLDCADRNYIVISDWHSIGVQTGDLKYRIPYLNSGTDYWQPTGYSDNVLPEAAGNSLVAANQLYLLEAMQNYSAFRPQH